MNSLAVLRRCWLTRASAVIIAAILGVTSMPLLAPAAHAADMSKIGTRALDRLARCIETSPDLDVLLLIDESASLQYNDADNVRGDVLPAFVTLLGELADSPLDQTPRHVEVAASSFAVTYREWISWTHLDSQSAIGVATTLRHGLAERNKGQGTNFLAALRGARQTMKAGASRFSGKPAPCKLMLWFTDGVLDVGNAAQDAKARAKMCAKSGPVSGLRKNGVITVAVLLIDRRSSANKKKDIVKGASDLRAAAESRTGKNRCGFPIGGAPGAYLEGNVAELARLIVVIISEAGGGVDPGHPSDPDHLLVDPGIAYFTLAAEAPRGLQLISPDKSVLNLARNGPSAKSGTIDAKVQWIGTTAYLTVPAAAGDFGEWRLRRAGATSPIAFYLYADLDMTIDDADLVAGDEATVRGTVHRGDGREFDLSAFRQPPRLTVQQVGSAGSGDVPVHVDAPSNSFQGSFTPAKDASSVRFVADLAVQTQHGMTFRVSRASVQQVVRLDYPVIQPGTLNLGSVRKPRETATGTVRVTGAHEGPSTVCLVGIRSAPGSDLSSLDITPDLTGCHELTPGQQLSIPVQAKLLKATAEGAKAEGVIELARSRASNPAVASNPEQKVEIPFSVQILPVKISWWLLALIWVIGVLLPFLLMYLVQLLARRLLLGNLMTGHVPVEIVPGVSPAGLVRTDGAGTPLVKPSDLTYLGEGDRQVSATFASGETLRARLSPNPFASPYGEVVAPPGWVVVADPRSRGSRDSRRARIPLRPDKDAYLLVPQSALAAAKDGATVAGTMVLLVAPVPTIDQAASTVRLLCDERSGGWADALAKLRDEAKHDEPDDPAPPNPPTSWGEPNQTVTGTPGTAPPSLLDWGPGTSSTPQSAEMPTRNGKTPRPPKPTKSTPVDGPPTSGMRPEDW